ncbi:metalloregulator ArsR/SmtB family transcription factor [Bacillota bacterium LX-D]|nr:metalloregulator ArsR/SmtB family transcription factor [Bacillota bacterium LX-D]
MINKKSDLQDLAEKAEFLKIIAHPVRLCILKGLLEEKKCNVSKMQDCLEIPQSTISQHLAKLRTAGIITAQRSGVEVYYSIANFKVRNILTVLFDLI